jgi:hypothetical protein
VRCFERGEYFKQKNPKKINHPTNIKRTGRSLLPPLMIWNETLDRCRQRQIGDKVTQANFGGKILS